MRARKLGETLIERGLITPGQLARALYLQQIVGGHLGSSLIDLGYVEEACLGDALAGQIGVDCASRDLLDSVPESVLRLLPREIAGRYRAVPLRAVRGRLHVALVGPQNLAHLDDLAFATGRPIVPWIAPERRILESIARHYRIPAPRRCVPLSPLHPRS